jgi:hypothetical protein
LFCKVIMKVDIKKQMREVKWTTEHVLSESQFKTLIDSKVERARKEVEVRKRATKSDTLHV